MTLIPLLANKHPLDTYDILASEMANQLLSYKCCSYNVTLNKRS